MILRYCLFIWFCVVFFISGLFVNLLQLLTLPFFWINRHIYTIVINKLSYLIFSELTFMAEWWGTVDLKIYGVAEDVFNMDKEKAIVVSNHFSDVDWLVAWVLCERMNFLPRAKVLMKNIVKYVPIIGWSWWFAEYGFLARNWSKDEASLLKFINCCKKSTVPYMIAMFCEGTRRTPEKLKASQEYAKGKNTDPLKYHLLPRTKGFSYVVSHLKNHVDAVYDCELGFPYPEKATVTNMIDRGTVETHILLRRIPISSIPCDNEQEAADYLKDMYKEKDRNMEYFIENGKFPAPVVSVPRRTSNLITFMVFNFLVTGLTAVVLYWLVNSFGITKVAMFVTGIAFSIFIVVVLLIQLTQTNRGSSFGLKTGKKD